MERQLASGGKCLYVCFGFNKGLNQSSDCVSGRSWIYPGPGFLLENVLRDSIEPLCYDLNCGKLNIKSLCDMGNFAVLQ